MIFDKFLLFLIIYSVFKYKNTHNSTQILQILSLEFKFFFVQLRTHKSFAQLLQTSKLVMQKSK
jgi:hypothetical protein